MNIQLNNNNKLNFYHIYRHNTPFPMLFSENIKSNSQVFRIVVPSVVFEELDNFKNKVRTVI